MSRFKIIEGENNKEPKIHNLTFERRFKYGKMSQKELYVYAYHLAREGDTLRAIKVLDKVTPFYLQHGIYKDLYRAILGHSLYVTTTSEQDKVVYAKTYEFFLVVKDSMRYFNNLQFKSKPYFIGLEKEFFSDSIFTNR